MDALGRASQGWGPHVEVEALLASDDHVIAFFHGSERDGETLDAVTAMPMKVNAEGKLTEIWLLGGDQRAFDQFWS
jgi:hypothetical protein